MIVRCGLSLLAFLCLLPGCGTSGGSGPDTGPTPPPSLTRYLTGNDADATPVPGGPGLLLMGGGTDVDAAFAWSADLTPGGDVVVLRTSGADGYNDYLFTDIGGIDSVETMLPVTRALADEPYVAWRIEHAELVFLAGGDQATYLAAWKGSALAAAIETAYARGAVVGGTSAGAMVLGELVFSAENGSIVSSEALADPFDARLTLDMEMVSIAPLAGVLIDTHFVARDRMGRLAAFLARAVTDGMAVDPIGIGIDEATALVVGPDGAGEVLGAGPVYVLRGDGTPARCVAGQTLHWLGLPLEGVPAGGAVTLPGATTTITPIALSASNGTLVPANPY